MPIKHNLTKYDILQEKLHKLSQKREDEYTDEELMLKNMGVLVAAFSSGHSWKTHKALSDNQYEFNSADIKDEFSKSKASKWKNVTSADIYEVSQKNIPKSKFASWLYYIVNTQEHSTYKTAWEQFNSYLITEENDGIETATSY
ncbi:hypothetical protein B2A_08282 [mine drainage metagenome]|uniref:Uncharacterized protein n=1 Tax=mine drainage metagenome TaxID=410659 RepID=T0ZT00_9ZZZZ